MNFVLARGIRQRLSQFLAVECGDSEVGPIGGLDNNVGVPMSADVIRVVKTYIDAVRRNDPSALPLHPEVEFISPLGTYIGSAAFRIGLADFVKILKGIRVIRFTADDDSCAAALELDTVFGVIPFLEHFHIVSGQILSVRAYYDPRPVLDGMKQKP
jgi:hypothetical protein